MATAPHGRESAEQTPERPGGSTRPQTRSGGSPETHHEAHTPHAPLTPRTWTPDQPNPDGSTTIKMKRGCNGCGQLLGDADNRDVDNHGNLTDVRAECPNCRPLVELEAAGCRTWQVTPRNYARLIDREIDQYGVFVKHFTEPGPDQRLTVVGIRVGERPHHVVARFGDWIIRHPDGHFTVHKAPAAVYPVGGENAQEGTR